jgi:hypothetical protein
MPIIHAAVFERSLAMIMTNGREGLTRLPAFEVDQASLRVID